MSGSKRLFSFFIDIVPIVQLAYANTCADWQVGISTNLVNKTYFKEGDNYTVNCLVSRVRTNCTGDEILDGDLLYLEVNGNSSLHLQIESSPDDIFISLDGQTKLERRFFPAQVPGLQEIVCKVNFKGEMTNSETLSRTIYSLPRNASVTGINPNGVVANEVYYDIGCQSEGDFPPSEFELRIQKGNGIYFQQSLESKGSTVSVKLTHYHHEMMVKCHDIIHSQQMIREGLPHASTPPLTIQFIEIGNMQNLDAYTVYKREVNRQTIRCSDYLVWRGVVQIIWYYVPNRNITTYEDAFTLRYV